MWIILAILSALMLGIYDIFKKLSVNGNNVLSVLFYNTLFCALLMSPVIITDFYQGNTVFGGDNFAHFKILTKSFIVLSAWVLGYFSIKHLPLTITGPISATRPVLVLLGAMLIFGERLNLLQWGGVALGFVSLFFISRIGAKEGFSIKHNKWLWLCIGSTIMGAISGLYDKHLLQQFEPLQVQAWYSLYQCIIMGITITIIKRLQHSDSATPFHFKWTIPCIAIFLTIADLAYFYALSCDGAMISIISMIRRGSVIVSFIYGLSILKEKNIKLKAIDLSILLIGLTLLILGSQ
ncbi:MAG: DMT family transporter [Muribaculaceae bacterium]|nr:DMT family transporter [Muribaculaceae bacterium]